MTMDRRRLLLAVPALPLLAPATPAQAETTDLILNCDLTLAAPMAAAAKAVRKVFYWGVMGLILIMILSGIAIWKPVQTYSLETLFGGFQGVRLVYFLAMSGIVAFLFVHLALVALVPTTLIAMLTGHFGKEPVVHTVVATRARVDVP